MRVRKQPLTFPRRRLTAPLVSPRAATRVALALCAAALATATAWLGLARADDTSHPHIEISSGYEYETRGELTTASLTSQSGPRIAVAFTGIDARTFMSLSGSTRIVFLPLYVVLDPTVQSNLNAAGVRSESSAQVAATTFRKVVGALVEGSYTPGNGIFQLRARLAAIDYDREKKMWDWRLAQADVGLVRSYPMGRGVALDLELRVGASVGGVTINDLGSLERAIGASGATGTAMTVNPLAMAGFGVSGKEWSIALRVSAEQRLDLGSSHAEYAGNPITFNSQRAIVDLRADFPIWRAIAGFVDLRGEYDNLTMPHELFGLSDAFIGIQALAGIRIRM